MGFLFRLIKKPIGCLFSILFSLLLLLVMLGVVAVLVLNHFAVDIAAGEIKQRTGFTLTTGAQDVGLFHGLVDLQNVEIKNPDRFPAPEFLNLKQFKVKADPWSVGEKRLVIEEVVVDLDSISVVRSKDGEFNVSAFCNGFGGGAAAEPQPFLIKTLTIRINSARYLNYAGGDGTPKVMSLNYERTFTDVTPETLTQVKLALVTDLGVKGVVFLAEPLGHAILDPATYQAALKTIVGSGQKLIEGMGDAAKGLGGLINDLFQ